MKIANLKQFEVFLKSRIPSREALFQGDIGILRAKHFMRLLGNPQNKLKVIHIAGTSGKGSTAYLTSHMLQSQGFKVGLSISPHVFDIRERMQINCNLIEEKTVLKYFNEILPIVLKMERSKYGSPTFFEISVGLAYYIFLKENVDYAIMETGLGGRIDATNTVSSKNKICLITKIGLDHTEILGKTISKIASEKIGVIQNNNTVISQWSSVISKKVIQQRCKKQNAKLFFINKKNYSVISSTPTETLFNFNFQDIIPAKERMRPIFNSTISDINSGWIYNQTRSDNLNVSLKKIRLGLIGKHQAENCSLALACLLKLSRRDKFQINENKLRSALAEIRIPGRMETRKINGQIFILDGAHNPQKMETFVNNLSFIYPNQKFIFAVAFKKGKDWQKMLKRIIPVAETIYLSEFSLSNQDNHLNSVSNDDLSKFLKKNKFDNYEPIKQERILKIKSKNPIIITGSLYFIGLIK